jgi:hypothetical protein
MKDSINTVFFKDLVNILPVAKISGIHFGNTLKFQPKWMNRLFIEHNDVTVMLLVVVNVIQQIASNESKSAKYEYVFHLV